MSTENIRALVRFRLEQADEALHAAQILLEQRSWRAAVNRSYYAMFYAVLALLALHQRETSKHSGVMSLFNRDFVKPGIFSVELSRWLRHAFRQRHTADYAALSTMSAEEVQQVFDEATAFVAQVKAHLAQELQS
jgi:uncharacterized protein (UPF0332 family)